MGAGVKSLHFGTVEEFLFFVLCFFLFFGQAPCHLEDDPEDEQISSGRGGGGGH